MNKYIDKTTYIEYLNCPKNTWLKLHKPDLKDLFEPSQSEKSLAHQGHKVEALARKLFMGGVLVEKFGGEAITLTEEYVSARKPVLFQATFVFDVFLARNDILTYDAQTDQWHLYEIKATNSLDENADEIDHIEDATFQAIILKEQGLKLGSVSIIYLNKDYILGDQINLAELFIIDDITEKILSREQSTRFKMQKAKGDLLQEDESALTCACIYKGRSAHCQTFQYSHMYVPEYSIHDISRIDKKKLKCLVDTCCWDIKDIPYNFKLSEKQMNQITVHRSQQPIIEYEEIREELNNLVFPLYFLDYETYASAIPLFKGTHPYQQVTFQFSLHVVRNSESEPVHHEYLQTNADDPSLGIIQKLKECIGPVGNVLVWNKGFEKARNAELGNQHPEHKAFMDDINDRLYDLMDVFSKQCYVHPKFKGSTSIKYVLPVLAPEHSYKELAIQKGDVASQKWFDMVYGGLEEVEKLKIAHDLKKYCCLDTYAMYAIWKYLMTTCNASNIAANKTDSETIMIK